LTVTSVGSLIITGADKYIIDFFWGNKDVGIYSMSSSIASMAISLIMSPLTLVVGPYIISVWESRNRGLAERLLAQLTRLTLLISLPMAVGLFVLSVPVLKLLTTPSYYPGSGAIPFIAGGAIFYGLSWLAGLGLALANRTSIAARNYLIAGGLDIFLNFLLVPLFGFVGSAMTYLVSSAFLLLLSAVSSRRYLEWVVLPRSTRNATLASIAMGMSVYLVILSFSSPLWQCIAGVGTGIAIYAIVLLLLGEFTQEEISEMKKLVK
jgi:O-antigen/teichoic acid export membrane protein